MSPTNYAAATDVGRVRADNEDAWGAGNELWVVADGMGGHTGGEVASRLAVETVLGAAPTDERTLQQAFADAHHVVVSAATDDLAGMGTTLVVATRAASGGVLVGGVGDSRIYLFADRVLTRVTADHNEAEFLLAEGAITAEQARTHPGRHVLTQAVGARVQPPRAQVHHLPTHGGRLLLCTDGLSGEVDDALLAELLAAGSPAEVAPALVDTALKAGGRDNVTVLVVDL